MCGIAGIFDTVAQRDVNRDAIQKMSSELFHRGRDSNGFYFHSGIGLAHRRLSIIAPNEGKQPMISADEDYVIIFNGMIYNYIELQERLLETGHPIYTNSDTEVLLYAYRAWGSDVCKYLDGFYSFAVYDKTRHELFLAVDRFGKKPLYYHLDDNGMFYFASELPALYQALKICKISCPVSARSLDNYFTMGFIPAPKTIFNGIYKVKPATHIIAKTEVSINEHTDIFKYPQISSKVSFPYSDAKEHIQGILEKSIRKRLISDVPLGVLLSGGTDSGLIASLLSKMGVSDVQTFTASFGEKKYDESDRASLLSKHLGFSHKILDIGMPDESIIDDIALIAGEPFADASIIPTYLICKEASNYASVLLSGDGADELFFGYDRYASFLNQEIWKSLFSDTTRASLLGGLAKRYPQSAKIPKFLRFGSSFEAFSETKAGGYLRNFAIMRPMLRENLYHSDFKSLLGKYDTRDLVDKYFAKASQTTGDILRQAQFVDLYMWLAGRMLVKADRASMAAHTELRSPFMDYELADYSFSLPTDYLFHKNPKKILKEIAEPFLPKNYLNQPKRGFVFPLAEILRNEWSNRLDIVCHETSLIQMNILDGKYLRNLMRDHFTKKNDNSRILWAVIQLDSFLSGL